MKKVSITQIHPNPLNPRKNFEDLGDLVASIRSLGYLDNKALLVRPRPAIDGVEQFELVDGERRWRACVELHESGLLVDEIPVDVGSYSDAEVLQIALSTASGQSRLGPIEEAKGLERLCLEAKLDQKGVAVLLGLCEDVVVRRLSLLRLGSFLQEAVTSGRLAVRTATLIAKIQSEKLMAELGKLIVTPVDRDTPLSSREAEALIFSRLCFISKAPWAKTQKEADGLYGPKCDGCPKVEGRTPAKMVCCDTACYQGKLARWDNGIVQAAEADGKHALTPEENEENFRPGEEGLYYRSSYVLLNAPVPPDLLKKEVAAQGQLTWPQLGIKDVVWVYVGIDQHHRPAYLVQLEQAVLAVKDTSIWSEETLRRYRVERPKAVEKAEPKVKLSKKEKVDAEESVSVGEDPEVEAADEAEGSESGEAAVSEAPKSVPAPGSIAADEQVRREQLAMRETKRQAALAWLTKLSASLQTLTAGGDPETDDVPDDVYLWSLFCEHISETMLQTDADCKLVLEAAFSHPENFVAPNEFSREVLKRLWGAARPRDQLRLSILMALAPSLIEQGVNEPWVNEWHQMIIERQSSQLAERLELLKDEFDDLAKWAVDEGHLTGDSLCRTVKFACGKPLESMSTIQDFEKAISCLRKLEVQAPELGGVNVGKSA